MGLPGDFHDKADGHAGVLVGAAEHIADVKLLAGQLVFRQLLDLSPDFRGHGVVVVLVALGGPPHGVLGVLIVDNVLVLGGTAGVDSGHDVDSAELGQNALVKAFQRRIHLVLEQLLIAGIVDNLRCAGNAVFGQIDFCHKIIQPPKKDLYIIYHNSCRSCGQIAEISLKKRP